jgi:Holliday junction resolvase RusA-like endonuclease
MTEPITITVYGQPAPQGSKRAFALKKGGVYTGRVAMVESSKDRVKTWRGDVMAAASLVKQWPALDGPLEVTMHFYLPRPKAHLTTGRLAGQVKPSAPAHPSGRPDTGKLARSTEDALTDAGIWRDDAQVVRCFLIKSYADLREPGAKITIRQLT